MKNKVFLSILSLLTILITGIHCTRSGFSQGKYLYDYHCAGCHGEDGKGLRQLYPPIAGTDYLRNNRDKLACIMRYGLQGEITVNGIIYNQPMTGIKELNDVEITNIINYINYDLDGNKVFTQNGQIKKALEQCQK